MIQLPCITSYKDQETSSNTASIHTKSSIHAGFFINELGQLPQIKTELANSMQLEDPGSNCGHRGLGQAL